MRDESQCHVKPTEKGRKKKKMNPCAGGVAQGQRVCINATANPQKALQTHKFKYFRGFPVY